MSFKAVFEFILLLHDFRNIDLPSQGLACVSASIYKQQPSKQKIYAIPYEFPHQRISKLQKCKILGEPLIIDSFFRSKVVRVTLINQVVPLDDFIQFQMELEGFPYLDTDNVFLELNLIFSSRLFLDEQKFEGKPVAQIKMKLNNIQNGIFAYSEADFKNEYFSKLSFTLYGQLMSYKFEKYQIKSKQQTSIQISRSKLDSFGKLLIWCKQNYLSAGQDPFNLFYINYVKNLRQSNYLTQLKLNNYRFKRQILEIKVSKKYLDSLQSSNIQIDQKILQHYLEFFKPSLSLDDIPLQIQQIKIDNFKLLNQVISDFYYEKFDFQSMKTEYFDYIKEKFGQRVFKNIQNQNEHQANTLKLNKKIAKSMRNKNLELTEHPIENQTFFNSRNQHELIFYEITLPQNCKQTSTLSNESHELNQQMDKNSFEQKKIQNFNQSTDQQHFLQSQNHENCQIDESSSNNTQKSDNFQNSHDFFSQSEVAFKDLIYEERNMLIVLCHGFQGSSYDMAVIQKSIKFQLPNAQYLASSTNQSDTEGEISIMGEKLADQIKYYIRNNMNQQKVIINFVGHSLGGIIARASLEHLQKFRDQLGFYCSLSSPHLGYLNGVDNKIKAGLWVIRKWKPVKSLDQLSMQEAKNPRQTFLYQLSTAGTLKYFRKIIFFSSFQDSYVSWHSARVSPHTSNNEKSKIQKQMIQNILGLGQGKNNHTTIHRLDINFNVRGNNIDSLIGRAAHINLIVQDSLFDVINVTLPSLFDLTEYKTGLIQKQQKKQTEVVNSKKKVRNNFSDKQKSRPSQLFRFKKMPEQYQDQANL